MPPQGSRESTEEQDCAGSGSVGGYGVPFPALSLVPAPANEKRSLSFLWFVTEDVISHYFGTGFWGKLVVPAADVYPTVRRSLLAVSTMYEVYLNQEHHGHRSQDVLDTPTSRSALLEYNKAVSALSRAMSEGQLPRQAVLICCLLFVWLEFLRNNLSMAFNHLKSGLLILQDTQQRSRNKSPAGTLSTLDQIDESVSHIFTRLQIQATLHGSPDSDFNTTLLPCPSECIITQIPRAFRDFDEARHCLDSVLLGIFQLIRKKQVLERIADTAEDDLLPEWSRLASERDSRLRKLEQWHTAFRNSPAVTSANRARSPGFQLLELYWGIANTQMKKLFAETEMEYDMCIADFRYLLDLAEEVVQSFSTGNTKLLTFDMGVIPTLFYIILKCRETSVRHKALELLKQAPEREGIWHRDSIVAAATFKVNVEELGVIGCVSGGRLPQSARIYREQIRDASDDGKPATVSFKGGATGLTRRELEIKGLVSRLGDVL